jgi:Pectate lyase superfamily protein/Viral BACON domain
MYAIHSSRFALTSLLAFSLLTAPGSSTTARTEDSPLTVSVATPLRLTVTQGGRAARSHALVLRNTGSTTVEWTASSNQAWLRFDPASGSLYPNATASVDAIADPTGFAAGIYVASAQITSPNTTPHTVDATMIEQSAFAGDPVANAERTFPPDSGMVNVKTQYGAKGDGVSDDTTAIQQAISSTVHHAQKGPRIIYFPAGTYLVSRPLVEKDLNSQWDSLLTLQGKNRTTTTIKLTDNNPLYQSASAPADVLHFASQNGGRKGGGNSGFDNNILDLTIDVGRGNPGAVALDFIGNNYCALRNVTMQSSDPGHSGAIGLALVRYAAGPCLIKNVVINGFDYGIRVANNEYSITFEDLILLNQKLYGIYNANNVLTIRHLFSTNSVPAIQNQNAAGLITLVGGILQGGSTKYSAIQNQGTLYARDVSSSGYASALQGLAGASITEYDSGPTVTQFGGNPSSLNLPIEETPHFEETNLINWKSVTAFGADPTGRADSSAAIQKAIDSRATTVYFPTGVYVVARTILVRDKVRMLKGFDSSLNPSGELFSRADDPAPLFKIEAGIAGVTLDHFRIGAFYPHPAPGVIFVQQDSARPLVLRDSLIGTQPSTIAYQNTDRGTGTLFVENVSAACWQILFPQNVFARQINPEGNSTKITNRGGNLWILGLKTEGTGTNIETEHGSTEVLGGLIYPVWKTSADTASFIVKDSRASFTYAVSSYKPVSAGTNFAIQVQETQHGVTKTLFSSCLPARGLGTMVPLYASGDFSPASNRLQSIPAVSHCPM